MTSVRRGAAGCAHRNDPGFDTRVNRPTRMLGGMSDEQKWPDMLWIVRHGESAGNVAREKAYADGLPFIDIAVRDVDVPLSALGERQSVALGRWFGSLPLEQRPTIVLTSPYVRAK